MLKSNAFQRISLSAGLSVDPPDASIGILCTNEIKRRRIEGDNPVQLSSELIAAVVKIVTKWLESRLFMCRAIS